MRYVLTAPMSGSPRSSVSADPQLVELRSQVAERDAQLAEERLRRTELEAAHERLWASYTQLKHELDLVKRRMFVASAERVDTSELQLEFASLVAQLDALAGKLPEQDVVSDDQDDAVCDDDVDEQAGPADPGSRPKATGKGNGKGRRDLSDTDLPQVPVEVPDAQLEQLVAEGKVERIGYETSRKLGYQRGGPVCIVVKRVKYRAVADSGRADIETAPLPAELLTRCLAAPALLARIAVQKCHRGLPLYRLEEEFRELGTPIDRGTMSRWLEALGGTFNVTVVDAMDRDARDHAFVILTDATGFPIQPGRFDRDGPKKRRPCRKGHFFVRIADRDHIIFEFVERHTSANVRAMFRGYEGFVQADAASVYDALYRPPDPDDPDDDGCVRIEVACWAHARRKYWEAALAKQDVARAALVRIGKIFEFDHKLRNPKRGKSPPPSKIKALRDVHVRPLVEELLAFARVEHAKVKDTRGPLRSALGYTVRQADALRAFLMDGRLRLDNNPSEGELRKIVRLRDAALFAGSDIHAQSTAGILTLIASARLHGLDPEPYIRDVVRVLPHWPREHYLLLAPKHWARTRALLNPEQLAREVGALDVPDLDALAALTDATE